MKIVSRTEFLKMKPGTVYSLYKPCIFGALEIKEKSYENDWLYQDIVDAIECDDSGDLTDRLFDAQENGSSLDIDFDCLSRDGLFDDDQLFAVWERKDVVALIERLRQTIDE